jgi:hypothetical protein
MPISSLGVTTSSVDDTDLFSTNLNGVVTSFSDCSETPTPTVCVGNKYIIKNDTRGDITIIGLTSPFTNTVYPSFTISSSTILVVCSCTSPNVGAGKLINVGLCSPTTQIPITFTGLTYIQDPEVMPNQTLSGTSLSALTTNILIEPNFAGTFDGGISQFRMYVNPLNASEILHNFDLLKTNFQMFDPRCPSCITGTTIV